jgi:hypothetical protein
VGFKKVVCFAEIKADSQKVLCHPRHSFFIHENCVMGRPRNVHQDGKLPMRMIKDKRRGLLDYALSFTSTEMAAEKDGLSLCHFCNINVSLSEVAVKNEFSMICLYCFPQVSQTCTGAPSKPRNHCCSFQFVVRETQGFGLHQLLIFLFIGGDVPSLYCTKS